MMVWDSDLDKDYNKVRKEIEYKLEAANALMKEAYALADDAQWSLYYIRRDILEEPWMKAFLDAHEDSLDIPSRQAWNDSGCTSY